MSAVARNLGLVLRALFGIGTARSLQGEGGLANDLYFALLNVLTALDRLLMSTPRTNRREWILSLFRAWNRNVCWA